ncbi:MAG: SCO family protein [Caldilineaceae bacterium]|nr:SCO family protein [Caldilineaceae bacterium]
MNPLNPLNPFIHQKQTGQRGVLVGMLLLVLLLASCTRPHQFSGTVFDAPVQAFPFEGTGNNGQPFRLSDHLGKVVVLFFGYTFCPDICPLTLADLNRVAQELGEDAQDLVVVLVTIDPERDTVERLTDYVNAFNPTFYGVRLEGEMYEATKAAYGVYTEKNTSASSDPENYYVDHSGGVYIIDKTGKLSQAFRYDAGVEAMVPDLQYWLRQ